MKIGCPKEKKNHEYRVGLIPAAAKAYVDSGHEVYVEKDAGVGAGILDAEYVDVGARLLPTAPEVWNVADMVVKVKEPLPQEYDLMRRGQLLYTYFHFAADENLTRACMEKQIVAVAYETVQEADGSLPLLKPMSEVAGRMAPIVGAYYLARVNGGRGILPSGVPGVSPARVLVLGGGTVGSNAARVAAGMGAKVSILDINLDTLEHLGNIMPPNVFPIFADSHTLEEGLRESDIIIGAVLIPGAYARSATFALNNRTIGYGLKLANETAGNACLKYAALKRGLNLYMGTITNEPVAEALGLGGFYKPANLVLGG